METGLDFWCTNEMVWSGAATILDVLENLDNFLEEGL